VSSVVVITAGMLLGLRLVYPLIYFIGFGSCSAAFLALQGA
jgi:hypothetical protein